MIGRLATAAPIVALGLALGGCMGSGCNAQPTPQSDTCELPSNPPQPSVVSVAIGQRSNGVFIPIAERSVVPLVVGGQGSDMFVVALRIGGSGVGDCTAQRTILEQLDGNPITYEQAPLVTRPDGQGAFVTGDILLPYYGAYGDLVRIRAEVGGVTDSVELWAGDMGYVDAAVDARTDARVDAAAVDGAVPDAMLTDAPPDA